MENQDEQKSFWRRNAPITVVGVLLFGLLCNTIYDLLVKPGLSAFGRLALDLLTLGSNTIKDAAYSSAGLDPTPVTGLMILMGALTAASFPAASLISRQLAERDKDKLNQKLENAQTDEEKKSAEAEIHQQIKKKIKKLKAIFWFIFLPWFAGLWIAFNIHNQSIVIWRIFHANMAIISPYISNIEQLKINASFTKIKCKTDYQKILSSMESIASTHSEKLVDIETW